MKDGNKKKKTISAEKVRAVIARVLLVAVACAGIAYAAEETSNNTATNTANNKLQNGSFEEGQTFENAYLQTAQSNVPSWNTTAFEGKIELFRKNPSTYLTNPNVWLIPTAGNYAAELNADEESTLYQVVKTTPSSVYEWGLDHGARNGTDIMALVIGPKQSVNPSKPSKDGRDHFMQMVDWLKDPEKNNAISKEIDSIKAKDEPKQYTVYSKKLAASGAFEDNAGNNAFSLTPSTIYTEEWHIWIMASSRGKDTSKPNPWNSYGSNAEGSAGSSTGSGSTTVDLSKYYLYTVPAGQTETVFGFVSVGYINSPTTADKAKTYGNFLDNINFQLYHPLSGSSSTHGSAVVGGSDGTAGGQGGSNGHEVTIDKKLATYIIDGEKLKVQAVIKKADADDGCEFVGLYQTNLDENGKPETVFLRLAGNEIEDTGSLTDEEKAGKWVKSTNAEEDIIYTYYLEGITSSTDLHFVFIKSPMITYDPNGGKPYVVERTYNTNEAPNVYSFKPAQGVEDAEAGTKTKFIAPYVSRAAEGDDGWKFMGWLLTGDTVDSTRDDIEHKEKLGSEVLPAEHTVACDYSFDGAVNGDTKAQYFKIYDDSKSLTKKINQNAAGEDTGVTWIDESVPPTEVAYANVHKGLTLVAQWRWRQAFIPQKHNATSGKYDNSDEGGTVEIVGIDTSDDNYNDAYNANGGKAYYAKTDERITVKATAKEKFTFEGWYDADGNFITANAEYSYIETKEGVNTYYARFSNTVTQKYIRQVGSGNTWTDTEDDKIGTLGRYTYTDAVGTSISSTATAGTGYKFVGWYDSKGNKVTYTINNGATISYTTTGDATYYARFQTAYTVKFVAQTKQANGSFKTDNVGGKVSVASVTDIENATASSTATANSGYKFLGWYDSSGNQLSTNATYSTTTTSATNNVTYYARFEIKTNVENQVYLSFVAESATTQIPSAFDGRNAGTGKNTDKYGLDNKYGNTISTGFKYSIGSMTNVNTIQITVTVPDSAYVKVGGTGSFTGNGTAILTDSSGVKYNKGSIQQISGATTLTYYWDATGLQANTEYGFVIDNLYAPGATATITVNGTGGTQVTNDNGVVNTASKEYRGKSHYPK